MMPAESVRVVIGVVLVLFWFWLKWRLEQERKAEAARGTVKTRRHRVLDRIALVFTALVVGGVAFYAEQYGENWSALVFGFVILAFTGWKWLQSHQSDRTP